MTDTSEDGPYDGPSYCGSCYQRLRDVDLPHSPDEAIGCPHCHVGLLLVINHSEWLNQHAAARQAWAAAVADGLIVERHAR